MIGAPLLLFGPQFLLLGYLVLLIKCNTIQINPARTAMPVETPSNVGKSDVICAISKSKIDKIHCNKQTNHIHLP